MPPFPLSTVYLWSQDEWAGRRTIGDNIQPVGSWWAHLQGHSPAVQNCQPHHGRWQHRGQRAIYCQRVLMHRRWHLEAMTPPPPMMMTFTTTPWTIETIRTTHTQVKRWLIFSPFFKLKKKKSNAHFFFFCLPLRKQKGRKIERKPRGRNVGSATIVLES